MRQICFEHADRQCRECGRNLPFAHLQCGQGPRDVNDGYCADLCGDTCRRRHEQRHKLRNHCEMSDAE